MAYRIECYVCQSDTCAGNIVDLCDRDREEGEAQAE